MALRSSDTNSTVAKTSSGDFARSIMMLSGPSGLFEMSTPIVRIIPPGDIPTVIGRTDFIIANLDLYNGIHDNGAKVSGWTGGESTTNTNQLWRLVTADTKGRIFMYTYPYLHM